MTQELDASTENHRFLIALSLLSGMILIILLPVYYQKYDNAQDLAAIFSGWMTSVVGFYFLQQNTDKAQQQTKFASEEAAKARIEATDAAKKTVGLVSDSEYGITSFKIKLEEASSTVNEYKMLYEEAVNLNQRLIERIKTL